MQVTTLVVLVDEKPAAQTANYTGYVPHIRDWLKVMGSVVRVVDRTIDLDTHTVTLHTTAHRTTANKV